MNSKNISLLMSFSLAIISFMNSCCNFNLSFLYLVGVAYVADFGTGSAAFSVVGSRVGILSKFYI